MRKKQFDATLVNTHTVPLEERPKAPRYASHRVQDASKVVVKMRGK